MSFRPQRAISLPWLVRKLILVICLLFIVGKSSLLPGVAVGDEGHNLASNAAVFQGLEPSQGPASPPTPLLQGVGDVELAPGLFRIGRGSAQPTSGPTSLSLIPFAPLDGSARSGDLVPHWEAKQAGLVGGRTGEASFVRVGDSLAAASTFLPLIVSYNTVVIPSKPTRVVIEAHATKISQLVGDYDRERQTPTANLTQTRYQLISTDLGVPFYHKGRVYLLFGDSFGGNGGDAIAYTTDLNPENGLNLDFIHNASGVYQPILIPEISQGAFEVPIEGVSVNGRMYIYHTTDSSSGAAGDTMGRSVVAVSDDDGRSFAFQYDLSRQYFINVSIVQTESSQWPGLPQTAGPGLVMFGSGAFRQSNVYLAFQPESQINTRGSIRFFAGLDGVGKPTWSTSEGSAKALFFQPCVGELSVSYNTFIRKWIMLYNCALSQTRGINMRWADKPWGPWSEPQILFRPWEDNGYCQFMHTSWTFQKCDNVQDPGRENEWGGEYGPYQFETLATGNDTSTTIYFTMSTWNPYTVVLMRARLMVE